MNIPDLFGRGRPVFSFEFFLPKPPEDMDSFLVRVKELQTLKPDFVTLTYGAGGSAQQKHQTIETAGRIRREAGVETACHLTCITHTKAEVEHILSELAGLGITHLVALRGDHPKDKPALPVGQRDFGYARDLVEFVRRRGGFKMAVAGYPETHPECPDPAADLAHLVDKVNAGGDWVVTQLFFDNDKYFDFVARARKAGVSVPIVPGIMPVTGYAQLKRFTAMCGASLPRRMTQELDDIHEDPEAVIQYGIDWATRQCRELLRGGAPGIHFYTLNRSRSTAAILEQLRAGA